MKTLLFSLSLFLPLTTIAQLSGFGMNAGGSFSNFEYGNQVNSLNDFDTNTKQGFTGGLNFHYELGNENTLFSPELFIIQNGSNEYYTDLLDFRNAVISRSISLDYVGIALPLSIFLPMDNPDDPYGDQYNGFMMQGKLYGDYAVSANIENALVSEPIEFQNSTDRIDLGYILEAGLVYQGFQILFGYNKGLKNIEFQEAAGSVNSDDFLINNKGFTVQIGFMSKLE